MKAVRTMDLGAPEEGADLAPERSSRVWLSERDLPLLLSRARISPTQVIQ